MFDYTLICIQCVTLSPFQMSPIVFLSFLHAHRMFTYFISRLLFFLRPAIGSLCEDVLVHCGTPLSESCQTLVAGCAVALTTIAPSAASAECAATGASYAAWAICGGVSGVIGILGGVIAGGYLTFRPIEHFLVLECLYLICLSSPLINFTVYRKFHYLLFQDLYSLGTEDTWLFSEGQYKILLDPP